MTPTSARSPLEEVMPRPYGDTTTARYAVCRPVDEASLAAGAGDKRVPGNGCGPGTAATRNGRGWEGYEAALVGVLDELPEDRDGPPFEEPPLDEGPPLEPPEVAAGPEPEPDEPDEPEPDLDRGAVRRSDRA